MADKIVEGYWDCTYCNTKGIGGLQKHCPNCGNPQAEGTKFYMDPQKVKYLEPEKAKNYGKGADWICAYCNSYNRHNALNCSNCGASKKEAPKDYFGNNLQSDSTHHISSPEIPPNNIDNSYTTSSPSLNQKLRNIIPLDLALKIGGILAIVLIIIFLLIKLFTPKYYTAELSDKTWERNIKIEELKTYNESDWNLPYGARMYNTKQEIKSYQQVFDHYEKESYKVPYEVFDHNEVYYTDNGDGTFTEHSKPIYRTEYKTEYKDVPKYRTEPVYATKYYYYIDRWTYTKSITSSGHTNAPYWNEEFCLSEKEREKNRDENYILYFTTDKKTYSKNVSLTEWNSINISDKAQVKIIAGFLTEYTKK